MERRNIGGYIKKQKLKTRKILILFLLINLGGIYMAL